MGLSLLGCAQGIRDLLTEKSEATVGLSIPMIAGHIPTIAEAFARQIAANPDKRDLLIPNTAFTNTIVDGQCDLTPNLVTDKLLLDFWAVWEIRLVSDPTFPPFHMITEHSQLIFRRPGENMFITAAVHGQTLHTRDTGGNLDADLGSILIAGPFIPTIAEDAANTTLPVSLFGEFQVFGARLLLGNSNNGKK